MTDPHLVGGRYELAELLGRGGMAEVRKGTDVRLGRTVAVKRLRTDLASDTTFQARFRREAQSAASLNHPSIVAVYDTGEEMSHDGTDVAQPYIVMEYVEGRTLREILKEGRKILPERALEITSGVLSALDYSHRMGIIHRDIKPGNVMLTPSGEVKVMDFGIARAVSDAQSTMTQTAAVVGTAQYLSPEQARGETVDSRSDVYSTGCLLYELLTGRPPFVGDSPVSVAYQHVREHAAPPSSLEEDLPPEVDQIVMKSLAKRVEDRYQSAAAMKADIDRYLTGMPVQAPAVVPEPATSVLPGAAMGGAGTAEQQAVADEDKPKRRRRVPLWALFAVLVVLILLAAFLIPQLVGQAPDQKSVPTLKGMTRSQAVKSLHRHGLGVGKVTRSTSKTVPKGHVMKQDPRAGRQVDPGTSVDLTLSSGKPSIAIPDVVGDNVQVAEQKLRQRGLRPHAQQQQSDQPHGNVLSVNPPVGRSVAYGSDVTLTYASGPRHVPAVVGSNVGEAEQKITSRGFHVNEVHNPNAHAPAGQVVQQSPNAGTPYGQGMTVTIVVSTHHKPKPSPTQSPTPSESPSPSQSPSPSPSQSGPSASPLVNLG
ncbi:MAG: Stk1 family PASTA domain-containing Ser/Thr kinase [Marmoricola sp.]